MTFLKAVPSICLCFDLGFLRQVMNFLQLINHAKRLLLLPHNTHSLFLLYFNYVCLSVMWHCVILSNACCSVVSEGVSRDIKSHELSPKDDNYQSSITAVLLFIHCLDQELVKTTVKLDRVSSWVAAKAPNLTIKGHDKPCQCNLLNALSDTQSIFSSLPADH